MTTKFSQGSAVQTLPPVCKGAVVIPITWAPPPYPQLRGFVQFLVVRSDGTFCNNGVDVWLDYDPAGQVWFRHVYLHDFDVRVQVFPFSIDGKTRVIAQVNVPAPESIIGDWFPPQYTPGELWESGELEKHEGLYNWIWLTLSTWAP